jgi:IgGFc binding protein
MARTEARLAVALLAVAACRFDPAYRDTPLAITTTCTPGAPFCQGTTLVRCNDDGLTTSTVQDCGAEKKVCSPTLLACTACAPAARTCDGSMVLACDAAGVAMAPVDTCDGDKGIACVAGDCVDLCKRADDERSNVGCEYWAVDLDNAVVSPSLNAAAQQFAVVVSNVDADIPAKVTVDEDDALPGQAAVLRVVGTATVAPRNLEVFKLGPREVDGSAEGTFNTGAGTALTRHAYRVRSNVPIVAYQFNPLENVNVFSNDASQLLPVAALVGGVGERSYVIAGWPQTIATSPVPSQNFGMDLRAFLAIVAVRPDTHVHVKSAARVIPGTPLPSGLPQDGEADFVLQPFEVLNLETGDFDADFTGSLLDSDEPIVVFPGSEASDAPFYGDLANRFCCADHLEEQATPLRAVGKSYALARMPNRTRAVIAAGGVIGAADEPEFYRIVATRPGGTHVSTTLPPPYDAFDLPGEGDDVTIVAHDDFVLTATLPVIVADTQASQEAAGIPRGLPGGDPSLTFVPPVEQWRSDYVLLTPDKYSFDFLVIAAPKGAQVFVDRQPVDATTCEVGPFPGAAGAAYVAYRCQLSFPVIDPVAPGTPQPGKQNDGVHHVQADQAVSVIAYGFDAFVSYAYAAGTQLKELSVK